MDFYSTNDKERRIIRSTFKEVLLEGQAPDGGLYMPAHIPTFTEGELSLLNGASLADCAYAVISKYVGDEIPEEKLRALLKEAYTFPLPIETVFDHHAILRLDQGPTASFKDVAALAMARMVSFFLEQEKREVVVLVATSGDTGSAVANAYHNLPNVRVVVLFPESEVSERQRKQMTTLGGNVHAVAVKGTFDDCQRMVKQGFRDESLGGYGLTSANSINFGRLLPQTAYYVYAYVQLGKPLVYAIPSGNFGNMMGAMLASRMGLPIQKLVIGVNENDSFPQFLLTEEFKPIVPSKNNLSNAMNVGHPSNLARLVSLYGGVLTTKGELEVIPNMNELREEIVSVSVNDTETKYTMQDVYQKYGVILEPHGVVAWHALHTCFKEYENHPSVVLETAHPAKFNEVVKEVIGVDPDVPESVSVPFVRTEKFEVIENTYESFVVCLRNILS